MREGFYSITYGAAAGQGFGMIALDTGRVVGADVVGGRYDGSYQFNPRTGMLDLDVMVTVPPGAWVVQGGQSRPTSWTFGIKAAVPAETPSHAISVHTELGPVAVIFRFLRPFP